MDGDKMNFSGRYYTDNDTLVAVHPLKDVVLHSNGTKTVESVWTGHVIKLEPPYTDDRSFCWDKDGKCNVAFRVVDDVSRYNLNRVANPMTYGYQIEVVDCEDCREWQKGRRKP